MSPINLSPIPQVGVIGILVLMAVRTLYEATWDGTPWCPAYAMTMGFYAAVLAAFLVLPRLMAAWRCHGCKVSALFTFLLMLIVEVTNRSFTGDTPLSFEVGELVGYAGVAMLSGLIFRKLSGTISELSRQRDLMASGLSEALWQVDCRTDTIFLDRRFHAYFGYPENAGETEVSWSKLVHPDDQAAVTASFDAAAADPKRDTWQAHYRLRHASGRYVWVLDRCRFDRAPNGTAQFAYGGVLDVTDRVVAEQRLRELNESLEKTIRERTRDLEETNRELGTFTYAVTHDLKSPLAGIMGYADLLAGLKSVQADPQARDFLAHITTNAERMNGFIADLLAHVREGGTLVAGTVRLSRLFKDLQSEFEPRVSALSGHLRFSPTDLAVHGNPVALHRVLQNLVGNAIKYHRVGVPPEITVDCLTEGDRILVRITDNGLGIPAADLEHIFDFQYRVGAHADREGHGLGLANVKQSLRRLGGSITVSSDVGKGSVFTVSLPAA